MGISSTLWRLSKLSWVSYGMRWWPGLCVTWRVAAEKAPFQAAHGSCQHHSGKETCWYPPAMGSCLAPCSPIPANTSAGHASKGADQCHHTSPHSAPQQNPQQHLFASASSKYAQVPLCVLYPPHPHPKQPLWPQEPCVGSSLTCSADQGRTLPARPVQRSDPCQRL